MATDPLDNSNLPPEQPKNLPDEGRSISKTCKAFCAAVFWFAWDWFWGFFNLPSVGDEVKEHSTLMKKRAAVFVVLVVIASLGGCVGWRLGERSRHEMEGQLAKAQELIQESRQLVAGKPTKMTPAELMGFHDETNIVVAVVVTNQMARRATITNRPDAKMTFHVIPTALPAFFMMTNAPASVLISNSAYGMAEQYRMGWYDEFVPVLEPVLNGSQNDKILALLSEARNGQRIVIYCARNDVKGLSLSQQLWRMFSSDGFNVDVYTTDRSLPLDGLTVASKTPLAGELRNVFAQLFLELGQNQQWDIEQANVPYREVWIYIDLRNR